MIEVRINTNTSEDIAKIGEAAEQKVLSDTDIGRRLAQKVKGSPSNLASQFGSFKNGRAPLSERLISPLSVILDLPAEFIEKLNAGYRVLKLKPDASFRDFLLRAPEECKTLSDALIWIAEQPEHRELLE